MKVLLIYATNSGGTFLASQTVEEVFKNKNIDITVKEVKEVAPDDLGNYELVILASPSWDRGAEQGVPHDDFIPFMEKAKQKQYTDKQFAVFGLGDTSYTFFCGAVDHLEGFVKSIGGKLVTPSLRIDGFFFDQEKNSKLVREWAENLVGVIGQ